MEKDKILSLVQLHIFLVTAQERYLKQAAKILGISSSAVSQNLKALEQTLKTQLFERDTRPLVLTASGRRLAGLGSYLMEQNERLFRKMEDQRERVSSLRLGLGESAAGSFGPWLIAALEKEVEDLEVASGLTKPMVKLLNDDRIDVLFSPLAPGELEDFYGWALLEEDYILVARRGTESINTLDDLKRFTASHPLIEYNQESSDRVQVRRIIRSLNLEVSEQVSVSTSYLLVGLVSQLNGWSIITPTNLWSSGFFLADVSLYKLPGMDIKRTYWVRWQKEPSEFVKACVKRCVEQALTGAFSDLVRSRTPELSRFMKIYPIQNLHGKCASGINESY
ncbi:LysR family transcriptional regulator [uncultured Parasutterella sp.]|uniref:LysR family transcriptional regulator n=1 Tax=uncultured Parasutterella sp. TaxID=1263098 RepID=UPI00259362D8|nr:LysR family transcriptional regulator [uncultured Parasutterella sp.]